MQPDSIEQAMKKAAEHIAALQQDLDTPDKEWDAWVTSVLDSKESEGGWVAAAKEDPREKFITDARAKYTAAVNAQQTALNQYQTEIKAADEARAAVTKRAFDGEADRLELQQANVAHRDAKSTATQTLINALQNLSG